MAVNPVTNQVYVANQGVDDGINGDVTVIDGATNNATSVTVPTAGAADYPVAMAVNPVANKIYVANLDSSNVTVIDGATNSNHDDCRPQRQWAVCRRREPGDQQNLRDQ